MVLVIDNYDSFTYNLVQEAAEFAPDIKVVRNDAVTIPEIVEMNPEAIIISPGPGCPKDAGICEEVITKLKNDYKILGVCLGHQAICEVMGGEIVRASRLMHGKQSDILLCTTNPLFNGLSVTMKGARYHSLIAEKSSLPDTVEIIAKDLHGEVMGVQIKGTKVFGVQFHPESILTPNGNIILKNFLAL